ncbi:MAG: hypothetical protein CGW95_00940 [Phenylobacterium zucineum]|nr:MAG: hypothetical protein CGW95_00940 [Phenylobacterium zucineum]
MARRKRHATEEAPRSSGRGLEEAFPASPSRPPKYGFYCYNQNGAFTYQCFCGIYAAKRFIEVITEGTSYKWLNCETILAENGVKISTTTNPNPKPGDQTYFEMEEVLEHEYTTEEEAWQVPEPMASQWPRFPSQGAPRERSNDDDAPAQRRTATPRPERPARPQRVEGNVSVATIAEQLGIDATKARGALRKASEPKPPQGWEWPPSEVERIKAKIKEHLK